MLMPTTIEKKMIESIFGLAAAETMFSGTMSRIRSTGDWMTVRSGILSTSAPPRSAPTPGRMVFTITRPTRQAARLVIT